MSPPRSKRRSRRRQARALLWRWSGFRLISGQPGGVSRMSDPKMIKRHSGGSFHSGYGKVPDRSFCGGADSGSASRSIISMKAKYSSPADDVYHIDKTQFKVPFVCGAKDLGEALRRIERRCLDDPYQGRAGNGRCGAGSTPYAYDAVPEIRRIAGHGVRMSFTRQQNRLQVPYDLVSLCA